MENDPDPRQLASLLQDLAWTIHRLVPSGAGVEPLAPTDLATLKRILETPGLTVNALAEQLNMRQSNTSAAIRSLIERGLVSRNSKPDDRRVALLNPTDKALQEKESIAGAWSGTVESALKQLSPEHVSTLRASSEALSALHDVLRSKEKATAQAE